MTLHDNVPATARVAVVGPVPPFRSGIARHTAALARALARRCEVRVLSFARQYPAWLFPGSNDREPGAPSLDWPETDYKLDCLNPLTWRRTLCAIRAFHPDLVLIPWWTVFWAPAFWYLSRGCRKYGLSVEMICHNVVDHETAAWKARLSRLVLGQATSFLVHSKAEAGQLAELVPGAKVGVHPHPLYDVYPEASGKLSRRAELEILFFGLVRPYKGLEQLIEAMDLLDGRSIRLCIVGEFWHGRAEIEQRIHALGIEEHVEIVPRYVNDQEAAEYFARADVVVLPYTSATSSGVIALAYHYGKPVIATRVGGLPDLVIEGETGLLVEPGSPARLAEAIASFSATRARDMRKAIKAFTASMTWEHLADYLLKCPAGEDSASTTAAQRKGNVVFRRAAENSAQSK